jgi:hypothetical protein
MSLLIVCFGKIPSLAVETVSLIVCYFFEFCAVSISKFFTFRWESALIYQKTFYSFISETLNSLSQEVTYIFSNKNYFILMD